MDGAAAFRSAPQALLAVDRDGVVRLANAEATRILRADPAGSQVADLFAGDPTGRFRRSVAAGRNPVLTTTVLRLPDGRQLPVDVRMAVTDPPGWLVLAVDDPSRHGRSRAALEQRVERLTEAEREQEDLLGDLIRAQERERARIAAAVHDDSLQVITAATLRLQQLRRRLDDPAALEMLARLEESIALAADRLRRLIFDFRPPALEHSGLAAAARDLLARLGDDTGVRVELDSSLTEPPVPTRLLLYRILQEAVSNAGRHASASVVEVTLAERDGGYLLRVADDGVGVPIRERLGRPKPGHLGITLMRERAEFAGGWFRFDSDPSTGTTVSAWIPRGASLESAARPPALRS